MAMMMMMMMMMTVTMMMMVMMMVVIILPTAQQLVGTWWSRLLWETRSSCWCGRCGGRFCLSGGRCDANGRPTSPRIQP